MTIDWRLVWASGDPGSVCFWHCPDLTAALGLLIGSKSCLDKETAWWSTASNWVGHSVPVRASVYQCTPLVLNVRRKGESYNPGYLTFISAFSLHGKQCYCIKEGLKICIFPCLYSSSVGRWQYTYAVNLSTCSFPFDKGWLVFQCLNALLWFSFFWSITLQ